MVPIVPGTDTIVMNHPPEYHHLIKDRKEARAGYLGEVKGFLHTEGSVPLAVAQLDKEFSVWRLPQDHRAWSLPCGENSRPVFSPDGKFLAAAGPHQQELQVYEVASWSPVREALVPDGFIGALDFSPLENQMVAMGLHGKNPDSEPRGGWVKLRDWSSGVSMKKTVPLGANPVAVRFHPSGAWLAAGTDDGKVFWIDSSTGEAVMLFEAQVVQPFNTLFFVSDVGSEGTLVAGSCDGRRGSYTHVWDVASGSPKYPPLEHPSNGYRREIDYRDGVLITPGGTHNFCELATGKAIRSPLVERLREDTLAFGQRPSVVVTSGRGESARVLDWRTGLSKGPDLVHEFRLSTWVHRSVPIPGTPWVAVCGINGVRFFDVYSGNPVAPPIKWPEAKRDNLWFTPHF
jgi:WD40 repeat protein